LYLLLFYHALIRFPQKLGAKCTHFNVILLDLLWFGWPWQRWHFSRPIPWCFVFIHLHTALSLK